VQERVGRREGKEQFVEREVARKSDNEEGSEEVLAVVYGKEKEKEMETLLSCTSMRIRPPGGTQGENLESFLRRFDSTVRGAVYPLYPDNEKGARQKEMDMALMIQGNLN
jgi:hypothetical protein